jgi:hypothetical protein
VEIVMETKDELKKLKVGAGPEPPPAADEYVCIDPPQRAIVFDFFKGFHQEQKWSVIAHLGLCLQCREAVATLLKLNKQLHPAREKYLHAERFETVTFGAGRASLLELATGGNCPDAAIHKEDAEGNDYSDLQAHFYGSN